MPRPILVLLLPLALLLGCPGDDDDSADDDDTVDYGDPPTVNSVSICEIVNSSGCSGNETNFELRFDVNASDPDEDLDQPTLQVYVESPPYLDCIFKQSFGASANLGCSICATWDRGQELSWNVRVKDFNQNPSEAVEGTWLVPATEEDTGSDCSPF